VSRLRKKIPAPTGTANFVSTIATIPARFADFFATIATSLLGTEKPQKCLKKPLSIYDVATDQIVSIDFSGQEEVFDVEVERTENFIANGVVSHNTRWSKLDLTGQIIDHMAKNPDGDQWEIVELPAILNEGEEDEKSLWPEFWPLEELKAKKIAMDSRYWQSQYMQNPTSEEGAIIKREWWNIWEEEKPPDCDFTIMSLDAAQETNNRADYNALTTWGVFTNEETGVKNIILLNSIKERLEFPELKKLVLAEYKEWEPDTFIVEKKSNGAALYQELRSMGVPVSEFTPSKGQDKVTRANAVADIFSSGMVWAPDTRWAREVVEEVASFPFGKNDDLVDSTTQALMRFRKAGFLTLPSDEPEEVQMFRNRRRGSFY
jgi:predicted phage terminase large subunit-like protein